ncbi:hypothetical protein [Mariprofundus erugo]|nr:hypothetical protein [Mariprofundus erugo]
MGSSGYGFISVANTSSESNTVTVKFLDTAKTVIASESSNITPGEVWALNTADLAHGTSNGYVQVSASKGEESIMPWGAMVFNTGGKLSGFPFTWNSSSGIPYQPEKARPLSLYQLLSVTFKEDDPEALKAACPSCDALVSRANKARDGYIELKSKWDVDALKQAIATLQSFEKMTREQWDQAMVDGEVISADSAVSINEYMTRVDLELAQKERKQGNDSMASLFQEEANARIEKSIKLKQRLKRLEKKQKERIKALDKELGKWRAKLEKREAVLRKIWKAKTEMAAAMASAEKCLQQFCRPKTERPAKEGVPATTSAALTGNAGSNAVGAARITQDGATSGEDLLPGAADITRPLIRDMPVKEAAANKAAASATDLAKGALGSLIGGGSGMFGGGGNTFGGGQGNGAKLVKQPKGPWDVVKSGRTGLELGGWEFVPRSNQKQAEIRIAQRIADSPDNGAPDSMWLQDANGNILQPIGFMVFELWRHWRLTVTVTRETYVNGELVSRSVTRNSTGWKELVDRYTALLEAPPIWKRLGGTAFDKLKGVIMEFPLPEHFDPAQWSLITHVTARAKINGKEVIQTIPFALDIVKGEGNRLRFKPAPDGLTQFQRAHAGSDYRVIMHP